MVIRRPILIGGADMLRRHMAAENPKATLRRKVGGVLDVTGALPGLFGIAVTNKFTGSMILGSIQTSATLRIPQACLTSCLRIFPNLGWAMVTF